MKRELQIYVLAACIASVAISFGYLAVAVTQLNQQASVLADELRVLRTSIPIVIAESERLRTEIPQYLDRVDSLITKAKQAGRQAGEGAVTGVFRSIVRAPFSLLAALGSALTGSNGPSASEREVIAVAMNNLVATGHPGVTYPFDHPTTGMTGKLELLAVDADRECPRFEVRVEADRKGEALLRAEIVLEHDGGGKWNLVAKRKL